MLVGALLAVAFTTLYERKFLRATQLRVGPQKTGFLGALQPLADGLKLFSRERVKISSSHLGFYAPPVFLLCLFFSITYVVPSPFSRVGISFSLLYFMAVIRLAVYAIFGPGFLSSSKYSLLGSLRALIQTISYEVSLFLIILRVSFRAHTYSFSHLVHPSPFPLILAFPVVGVI